LCGTSVDACAWIRKKERRVKREKKEKERKGKNKKKERAF
jgi:hypothetical protein